MNNKGILLSIFIQGIFLITYPQKLAIPSKKQIGYQKMELVGFIHFNMNTFTNKEWGYGDEDPKLFDPKKLDVEQWVKVAKMAGMKELILTAKHHDGFCLWPSAYTEHSIKNSSYKNGKGDIVKEFTTACHKYGIKAGLYLSPWDRNASTYGTSKYIEYYINQLKELLTNYGTINEIWFDGANGGDGYYGGAKEKRTIDSKTYYPWKTFANLIYRLQPQAVIFSDAGPDLRWIGNENGIAGETFWSPIDTNKLVVGASDQKYLNTGDPHGKSWLVGVCDVSIRPGWFYHIDQDSHVKTAKELVDLYYKSVGRNAVLLLNIPPDKDGLINSNDINELKKFRTILDETFKSDLVLKWNGNKSGDTIEATLNGTKEFDRILLQENIKMGQRISAFEVESRNNGQWEKIAEGTTIGFKRLIKINSSKSNKLRLIIRQSFGTPQILNFAVYKSVEED